MAVVAAILTSGLHIMPHSGGRVGKGIYFASENSKSAGYGEASLRAKSWVGMGTLRSMGPGACPVGGGPRRGSLGCLLTQERSGESWRLGDSGDIRWSGQLPEGGNMDKMKMPTCSGEGDGERGAFEVK